jgi:microcystin-dependent protein
MVLGNATGTPTAVTPYAPTPPAPSLAFAPTAISMTTGNQPHSNMMPYLAMQFCIALSGVFPSRN